MSADIGIEARFLANVTQVEWRTAIIPGHAAVFLVAHVHFTVLDPDTLPMNWGESARGIRSGLSIDRAVFHVGDRIPLHFTWEDVDASVPLGRAECGFDMSLEIQDANHHVLKTVSPVWTCLGHGWGPFVIQKSYPQRSFVEIPIAASHQPWPQATWDVPGPGVYYLVSLWSPHVLRTDELGAGRLGSVYATARSAPVRIEVLPKLAMNR